MASDFSIKTPLPLEVGDAQVNRRGLLAHEHPHPVGHGWLVAAKARSEEEF